MEKRKNMPPGESISESCANKKMKRKMYKQPPSSLGCERKGVEDEQGQKWRKSGVSENEEGKRKRSKKRSSSICGGYGGKVVPPRPSSLLVPPTPETSSAPRLLPQTKIGGQKAVLMIREMDAVASASASPSFKPSWDSINKSRIELFTTTNISRRESILNEKGKTSLLPSSKTGAMSNKTSPHVVWFLVSGKNHHSNHKMVVISSDELPEVSHDAEHCVPIPIQTFLWRQTCPFIRPRLGKLHEATCVSLEKVLVQNIQFGLSPSLTEAIRGIPRWRMIQTAFPHVMHCTAQLLINRKLSGIQGGLGAAETKLLYTLHWILIDSAEECADADFEKRLVPFGPFHYLFPISAVTLFVYLFAPLCQQLRPTDFNNFRLENGYRIWGAMWSHKSPDPTCFVCPVKPKQCLDPFFVRKSKKDPFGDVFTEGDGKGGGGSGGGGARGSEGLEDIVLPGGEKTATPPPTPEHQHKNIEYSTNLVLEDELEKLALPTTSGNCSGNNSSLSGSGVPTPAGPFPETIPEESSSNDEEHVMIFRLGSIPESDGLKEATLFKMSVPTRQPSTESAKTSPSPSDKPKDGRKGSNEFRTRTDSSPRVSIGRASDIPSVSGLSLHPPRKPLGKGISQDSSWKSVHLATFMDVAVLRCLFIPHWEEEGVHWGLTYMLKRFEEIIAHRETLRCEKKIRERQRSNSLPVTKSRCSFVADFLLSDISPIKIAAAVEKEKLAEIRAKLSKPDTSSQNFSKRKRGSTSGPTGGGGGISGLINGMGGQTSGGSQYFSQSACSSPTVQRRGTDNRRSSEKGSKRKLTMLDLKTFVETKLLSKSEKMLEKVGKDGALLGDAENESDSGGEPFTRPQSALGHREEPPAVSSSSGAGGGGSTTGGHTPGLDRQQSVISGKVVDTSADAETMGEGYFNEGSNLFKGKSMPSLSCLLVDELAAPTGYCGMSSLAPELKPEGRTYLPNPIITVTEHTPAPTPSPDRMYRRRASSLESQLNSFIHQFALGSRRGSGRRGMVRSHSDSHISYSVSETSEAPGTAEYIKTDGQLNVKILFKALHSICSRETIVRSVRVAQVVLNLIQLLYDEVEKDTEVLLVLDAVTKIVCAMGCTHGCGEAQRGNHPDSARSHAQSLLLRLTQRFRSQFAKYFQNLVAQQSLSTIMEFFHALCSFCADSASLLSPMNSKIKDFYSSYVNGLENNNNRVECHIFRAVFKKLITRLAAVSKELRATENMALYCDVRQFVNYVYENDGNTFRKVALSALLDSVDRPNKRDARQTQTTRIVRRTVAMEESSPSYFIMDETSGGPHSGSSNKKGFFKKKSSSSTCASMGDTDNTGESPSGTLSKKHATLTPKSSQIDLVPKRPKKGLVSWLTKGSSSGGEKSFELDYGGDDSNVSSTGAIGLERLPDRISEPKRTMRQATIVQKAKRRVEERLKKMKMKRDSTNEESLAGGISRRGSLENVQNDNVIGETSEFVVLKERRLVNKVVIKDGLLRFGFLLEITHPGSLPDAGLMAALLDLPKTVVVARASMMLECCYLVHSCNRGHWPLWMKFPIFRPSCAGLGAGKPAGSRTRSHGLQRTSGKMFFQWGEAVNARLEEFIKGNKQRIGEIDMSDESKQKELCQRDDEEDFLDEASITDGSDCPLALQILCCMLLYEITAFMRETYQTLPKASAVPKEKKEAPPEKEKEAAPKPTMTSGARRWSYGLSSMGQSQTSQASHSLQSITDNPPGTGGAHPVIPTAGERKISFVLNDNESTESADKQHNSHDPQGNEGSASSGAKGAGGGGSSSSGTPATAADKKVRPLLLRRGTPSGSSFRRRSIKLQRSKKDGDSDSMKRSDSLTSGKRKVSSVSDETSEHSGDESPGVLSNEDGTGDDDHLYMGWINTVIEFLASLNYRCIHQGFCHPLCPRRLMRGVSRLLKGVRKVYGEEFGFAHASSASAYGMNLLDPTPPPGEDLRQQGTSKERHEESTILKYIKNQVQEGFHPLFSVLLKAGSLLSDDQFLQLVPIAWELLLEPDIQVSSCAAALLIMAGVKVPEQVRIMLQGDFEHHNPNTRMNALLRFQVLWKCRHQVWPRMEENSTFKAPPPGIEFTLPSPRIGVECIAVVDPPWLPQTKAKVEEVTLSQDPHVSRRYLVTATKTRKTQQAELVKMALQQEEDKKRSEREQFLITTASIIQQASYEPSLHHAVGDEEADEDGAAPGEKVASSSVPGGVTLSATNPSVTVTDGITVTTGVVLGTKGNAPKAHAMFPSSLGSAAVFITQLLDDPAVTLDGFAVYEVAYQVLWNCLVEDSSLFLRFVFEKLTRGRHEIMFKVLRHIILFIPRLPQQAAFALYNHIIGFIMFHTRSPQDTSPEMIGSALSVLWMVVHSVQGIMFKDLKQILRKEQCDSSIMLTANVPAAKKIVVHGPFGPEAGGIPTQFPVQEDTQFVQILREAYDFFSIDEEQYKEYFLVDHKTHQIHNPNSYVRDFYFFSRAAHPQLSLTHMAPDHAYNALQRQSFILKFLESGKVTLTWAILKNVDQVMQRVVFLHEELMKLPSFPRKALETEIDICKGGMMGKELLGLDVLHKFMWTKLITRMFEAMTGNFAYSGDIHLFLNVLSGSLLVHSEDATIIRYVIAAFINAAQQFKNIFSTNGYLLVMPPLLLTYCNHQSNPLVTGSVEFAVKEFYLLHRKPFVLQMFGALAALLDTDEQAQYGDPTRVPSKCLFRLLLSLETPTPDPLHITELIHGPQPLRPLDFCYHDDSDEITVLDCISMCVCVVAYASDSLRGQQMLTILEAVLPPYLMHIQTNKTEGKTERDIINHCAVAMKTLVNNCEPLAKNYSGPQMSSPTDLRGSSQRNYTSKGGIMTPGYEFADDDSHSKYMSDPSRNKQSAYDRDLQDSEVIRDEFRRPRDTLLCLVSDFFSKSSARLPELAKKGGAEAKPVELLDLRSHTRLADVAMSLLKVSPYDPPTMGCRGLQKYMVEVFPYGEWTHESSRTTLTGFLRRLDKTFVKICKKPSIRRHTDWEAAAGLLKGIYQMLWRHPHIVHNQHLKSLITTCECLLMGEGQVSELGLSTAGQALMGKIPPTHFCSTVVRLLALQVRALGETYSLEQACGLQFNLGMPQDRSDVLLMHLLIPMCLRVGTGRKGFLYADVPKMRKADIIYILNVILTSLNSGGPRIKSAAESNSTSLVGGGGTSGATRTGSVTERKLKQSTCQIAFLGLKILCVCFDSELSSEWPRTVRIIQELGKRGEGGAALWEYLEFVVSVRSSIYPMFRPLIAHKLNITPANDQERHFQFVIREKLKEVVLPKCKGLLLLDLAHQVKQLKEDLETRKETELNKRNLNPETNEARSRPRPSLSELFPGLAARFGQASGQEDTSKGSTSNIHKTLNRESSVRVKPTSQGRMVDRFMRRVSIAGDSPFTIPENSILKAKDREEGPSMEHLSVEPPSDQGGGSFDEECGTGPKSHRLQRQKHQSRKTFRFRKSRKGDREFSSVDVEEEGQINLESPSTPLSPSPKDQDLSDRGSEKVDTDEKGESPSSSSKPRLSLRLRSRKGKKGNASPQNNGADCESQNSFSRTSSTCGYRESFGSVERYSLQMLERLEVSGVPAADDGAASDEDSNKPVSRQNRKGKEKGEDDQDTLI